MYLQYKTFKTLQELFIPKSCKQFNKYEERLNFRQYLKFENTIIKFLSLSVIVYMYLHHYMKFHKAITGSLYVCIIRTKENEII